MDLEKIKQLIRLAEQSDITGLAVEEGDLKIEIRKNADGMQVNNSAPSVVAALAAAVTKEQPKDTANLTAIKSPMGGTFYPTPGPGEPPFVSVGDTVSKGQLVCVIEAMKTFNEIEADASGTIAKILVQSGQQVELGQPLFLLK